MGVSDALKDATTAAKVDGNITDYTWEKHIRPAFDRVRPLLKFRFPITESAKATTARKEKMVPHTKVKMYSMRYLSMYVAYS